MRMQQQQQQQQRLLRLIIIIKCFKALYFIVTSDNMRWLVVGG